MSRLFMGALLVALSVPSAGLSQFAPTALSEVDAPAARGRLVVKYAPTVDRCAQRILAERGRFADAGARPSLDETNARLGVTAARPLAMQRGQLRGAQATATYFDRQAKTRARFAQRAARAQHGAQAPDLSNLYIVDIDPELDVYEAARIYEAEPDVIYAHPDYEVTATFLPNDPFFASSGTWGQSYEDLWGLHRTEAANAWDTATGNGAVVAVIDTGIDLTHPDLQANLWTNAGEIPDNGVDDDANGFIDDVVGWDFYQDDNDPTDLNGHGTHVAGTIAAVGNNGIGVVGMSWEARVMAVRGLGASGSGYSSDLAKCILYAAENGADVINNSWIGFRGPSAGGAVSDAIATALSLGTVVVAGAGNDGVDLRLGGFPESVWSPAGVEGVITVTASDRNDNVASFSNHGRDVTVSAPGVDILSLRADHSSGVGGSVVAGDYLRLNGTSMASPHGAGLAALLLSDSPSLTLDEVRWHIELNADQPGYPGCEGQEWNPYHGWGRINAAQVFNTPPTTTRFSRELPPKHAFPDMILGPGPEETELTITTTDPTSWTTSAPPWLQVSPSSGSNSSPIEISFDTTGRTPGPWAGSLTFDVPGAVDGGISVPTSLYVHRDERLGPEVILNDLDAVLVSDPRVVSNGLGTLVVWTELSADLVGRVMAVHVDAAGTPSAPYPLSQGDPPSFGLWAATDGHGYVVLWSQDVCKNSSCSRENNGVMLVRLGADGQPIDSAPILVDSGSQRQAFGLRGVDFDGEAYTLLFAQGYSRTEYSVQRLGMDGVFLNKRRRIGHFNSYARFACTNGSCLMSWSEILGTTPGHFYIYGVKSVQIVGEKVVSSTPKDGPSPFFFPASMVSDGTNFLLVGQQHLICANGSDETICREDAVATRLAPDGTGLDASAFPLNYNSPLDSLDVQPIRYTIPGATVFDGTSYLLPFAFAAYSYSEAPKIIFLARLRPDGSLIDSEDEGLLVRAQWTNISGAPQIAVDATRSIVVFREKRKESTDAIFAVPVLARSVDPSFAPAAIGTIGNLAVDEMELLRLALSAPGLVAGTTAFTATNLPPGAHLDRATGLFAWRPNGAQQGAYSVHFEATNGNDVVSEDVTIDVAEASLSISGTARFAADGSPASGFALKLAGMPKKRLTAYTDAQGNYHFDNLLPGRRYRIRLTKPSKKLYRSDPRSHRVELGVSDVTSVDLTVFPR